LRVEQFALPLPHPDATVFRRGSFGCDLSSGAAREAFRPGDPHMPDLSVDRSRWLQTPCALRLGGPNL